MVTDSNGHCTSKNSITNHLSIDRWGEQILFEVLTLSKMYGRELEPLKKNVLYYNAFFILLDEGHLTSMILLKNKRHSRDKGATN